MRCHRNPKALARVGIITVVLTLLGGCPAVTVPVGVAVAATTVTFLLDAAGVIDVRAGASVRSAGLVKLLDGAATDRPVSANLNLDVGHTQALPVGTAKLLSNQSLSGSATVNVRMAAAGATNPCVDGIIVGVFNLAINAGVVSCANPSLPLPPDAVEFATSGAFAICLEVSATIDVQLIFERMEIEFGPEAPNPGGPAGNDNGSIEGNANANNGLAANDNANSGDSNANSNAAADPNTGFSLASVLHVGSEAIIAGPNANASTGWVIPEKFNVGHTVLSGDGQYVWFYLYWDSIETAPSDWIRLYRMHISGGPAERSLINEEAAAIGTGFLATNYDGSIAVFEMQRCEPAGVFCRGESRFLRLRPGQPAARFYDTEDDAAFGSSTGIKLTDDGARVYWHNPEHLWWAPTAGGGARELASVAHLNFYGPWDPFTGGQLFAFDITGDGGRWLLGVRFVDPQTNQLRFEMISAAGELPQNLSGVARPSSSTVAPVNAQWTDDGSVIAYCDSNAFGTGAGYILETGGPLDLNTAAEPTGYGQNSVVLSDEGNVLFANMGNNPQVYSGAGPSYFLDVATRTRRPVGTTRFQGTFGGVYDRMLSDNGQVMAGRWNARGIGTPLNNIYVLRDGVDGLPGFPHLGEIWKRYDAARDALVLRVKLISAGGLERIYLLPHKNGVEPSGYITFDQNPLFDERGGGGVNLSTTFNPVPDQPGVYERVVRLGGKAAQLGDGYTVRIIAVDDTGTRTSFRDVAATP